ncbi:unnamed protein product, partial [Brassica oleracea var. botrytis]
MSHRYSRAEKGKGLAEHSKQRRKLPVRIPAEGNVARLEDFNLTLIGRVTNPAAQNTRAEWRREPSHSLHRSSDKTYVSDYIRRDYRKNYDSQGCYERDRTSLARRADDYSLSRSENQRNHTARPPPGHPPPPTWRPVTMAGNLKTPTQSIQSQVSHTPSPRPLREVMLPPGNATARNTGDHEPHSGERRSALERILVPERLSGQPTRVPLLHNGVANLDSGRLQEMNIQYLEDTLPPVSG